MTPVSAQSRRLQLHIDGMHCDGCNVTVANALREAGLRDVSVDWRTGSASGAPMAGASAEAIERAVAGAGYALTGVMQGPEFEVAGRPEDEYDLVILGGGSAAFAAAIKARDLGARVAMVERDIIGGTCVNVGCVPSKALLRAAEAFWRAGHNPFAGVPTRAGRVDVRALVRQKQELIDQLRQEKYSDLIDLYDIDLIAGEAHFVDEATVAIGDRRVRGFRFLVATGAEPWVPPIPGIEDVSYLTSTTALELQSVPARLLVVGANAIGLELGQLFLHLGSQVTFVEALERIAPFEEPEISAALHTYLERQGATIHAPARVTSMGRAGEGVWLDVQSDGLPTRLEADRVLMATGRRARTAGLGLEAGGIEVDAQGRIPVDPTLQTTNRSVYAAGDVTWHPQFVYVAARAGSLAAENALRGTSRKIDFATMPRIIFTTPTVASVGLTEAEAREAGYRVITSILPLDVVPRALVEHATDGLVKLVADETAGHLLGAHLLAEGAGDVIQALVMALRYRATVDEIADAYHPYLTMAEALKLAAQGFTKDPRTLSCCAA